MLTLALILGIALAISFLCSLLEACLLSMSRTDLALLEQRNPRLGRIWRGLKENLEHPLTVILLLNTCAHTIGASLGGAEFERLYGTEWLLAFSIAVSLVMIQWTEILPKALGVHYNLALAPLVATPLSAAVRAFGPLVWLIHALNRPFERSRGKAHPTTVDEIRALTRFALISRMIEPLQEKIISGAAQFSHLPVGDLMIPRDEVSFLSASMTLSEALVKAHTDSHTRYPLCEEGDRDKVIGYVNFKELISDRRTNPKDATLRGIARPMQAVSTEQSVASVLSHFAEEHQHLAVVKEPGTGRTAGLITLEDILETPLGEFPGELDTLPTMFHTLSANVRMVGGGVAAEEVGARIGVPLPDATGTLSDWMLLRLGGAPHPNDTVSAGRVRLTVRRVRRRKVFEAMLEVDPAPPPAQP